MSKVRARQQRQNSLEGSERQKNRVTRIILLSVCLVLFVMIGSNIHPTCAQNCQNRPAYFYGVPLPYSTYSQFYGTDENGNPLHSTSNNDNSGHSTSSNDEEGGFHGGSFHGGGEP